MKFRDSGELLAAINGLDMAIMVVDSELRIRFTNKAFLEMWEVGKKDLKPGTSYENWLELAREKEIWPQLDDTWEAYVEQQCDLIRAGNSEQAQLNLPNGTQLLHSVSAITDTFRLISYLDITEQIENERSLVEARLNTDKMKSRLTQAIETLEDGFVIFDDQDRLVICNDAFRDQFGKAAKYLVPGKTYREMTVAIAKSGIIPGIEGKEREFVDDLIEKRKSELGLEKVFQAHDGRWIKQRDKKTDDGEIVGVRIDVTNLKQQQEELQQAKRELEEALAEVEVSHDRFKQFAEVNADWFWEMGPDLRFTFLSAGFEHFMGISPDGLIGKRREEISTIGLDEASMAEHLQDLEDRQAFRQFVYPAKRDDGETIWISISGNPIWNYEGEFAGYMGSGTLVTAQIERTQELEQIRSEIESQKELLDLIIGAADNGILVTRGLNEIVKYNDRMLRFLDIDEEDIAKAESFLEIFNDLFDKNHFDAISEQNLSREEFLSNSVRLVMEAKEDFKTLYLSDGKVWRYRVRELANGLLFHSYVDISIEKNRERDLLESRAILSSVLETSENGCLVTDIEHNIIEYNNYFCDMLDCPQEKIVACKNLEDVFDIIYEGRKLKPFHKADVTRDVFLAAAYDIHAKATNEPFTLYLSDGRFLRYRARQLDNGYEVHSFVDVSAEKQRHDELENARTKAELAMRENQKNEELFKAFAETNSDWFWKMDKDLRFSYFSENFEDVTDVSPDRLLGKTRRETGVPGVTEEVYQQHLDDLDARRAFRDFIHSRPKKDGSIVWLAISGNPSFSIDGEFDGYVGSGRDVTQQINRQKQLEEAISAAESAERAKSEFLANMSHEIRTPMNGVMGMAELLAQTDLDDKQKMFTDVIVKSGASLLTIINDILDFSKIDAGQMELVLEPFNLAEAIEDVATLVSAKVAEKDLELIVRVNPKLPNKVVGDVGRLRQVITNLLGNAVKFTEKGHVYVNVDGQRDETGRAHLKFSIEDTGIGIPPEKCYQVFNKFSQVDNSATRNHEGTGLGLSIATSLVSLMGGEIKVESEVGTGSTFWFEIDLDIAEEEQPMSAVIPGDLSGARVLIVDDNPVNRSILTEQMTAWEFDSAAAASGSEAFKLIDAIHSADLNLDLLILDFQMPEMSGLDVLRKLRLNPETAYIPVIMLSSVDSTSANKEAKQLNVDANLTKPTRSSTLLETILQVIARRRTTSSRPVAQSAPVSAQTTVQPTDPIASDANPARHGEAVSQAQQKDTAQDDIHGFDVLIAEDNEVNQIVFTQIMDETNVSYKIVENGKLALSSFKEDRPRLILMDVSMPAMNGKEATQAIRKYEHENGLQHTPIVGVTAHALKGDMDSCLEAGMDDYLSKPVSPDKLVGKVNQWLNLPNEQKAAG